MFNICSYSDHVHPTDCAWHKGHRQRRIIQDRGIKLEEYHNNCSWGPYWVKELEYHIRPRRTEMERGRVRI